MARCCLSSVKGLPNNIIYRVDVIPQVNDGNYGTLSTKSKIRTDKHSPLCLSTTKCSEELSSAADADATHKRQVDAVANANVYAIGCDNRCYNDIQRMIVENRLINVEGNYTINIM